jgi:hypothetical protein
MEGSVISKISKFYDVNMLIECLSMTNLKEKTKNEVIILIGMLSEKFPENIINHLPKIFSILEESLKTETSFDIINKSIIQIIPLIKDNHEHIHRIISIFINLFNKIPHDQRLNLFTTMISSIARKKMFIVVLMILNSCFQVRDKLEFIFFRTKIPHFSNF